MKGLKKCLGLGPERLGLGLGLGLEIGGFGLEKILEGLGLGLGLVSNLKSKVSVSSQSRTATSRLHPWYKMNSTNLWPNIAVDLSICTRMKTSFMACITRGTTSSSKTRMSQISGTKCAITAERSSIVVEMLPREMSRDRKFIF